MASDETRVLSFLKVDEIDLPEGEDIIPEVVYLAINKDKSAFDIFISTMEGDKLVPFSGNKRGIAGRLTDLFSLKK